MKTRRKYVRGAWGHVYQRTFSRGVIFYSVRDFLEFYMIFCIYARKYRIRVLGLCLMFDHVHFLIEADSQHTITAFIRDYTAAFSKAYNARHGLQGPLFEPYGMANKSGDKAKRTALAYVYNNPVEAKLCTRADQWPWNFLAGAISRHPFSEKLLLAKASAPLRRALRFVDFAYSRKKCLSYHQLDNLFAKLGKREGQQLTDYVVRTYSCVDFGSAIRLYGTYDKMLLAFSANTGSEYDIPEEYERASARLYIRMSNFIAKEADFKSPGGLFTLSSEEKIDWANRLLSSCRATPRQVQKFLHLPVED